MISSLYNKQEVAVAFDALTQHHQLLLEVLLVNPRSNKFEGRGYFNDVDFLCEAVSAHVGRYNFALTLFAFAPDQIPSRNSYNQFDRSLGEMGPDLGRPHSFTLAFQFKPEILREMEAAGDFQQGVMRAAYQVGSVLERLQVKSFALEYNPLGITARFLPLVLQTRADLGKPQLQKLAKAFQQRVDKEMFPAEHKKFALAVPWLGGGFDPMPGLPGLFGDAKDVVTVWSLSQPRVGEEPFFADLIDTALNGKKAPAAEVYAPSNLQGLSQNWDDGEDGFFPGNKTLGKPPERPAPDREDFSDRKQKEEGAQLEAHLKAALAAAWTWPLQSQVFTRLYGGLRAGQVLLLQADPFAGDAAFHFLMQSAEPLAKEGRGQILVFSKKRAPGDLAVESLARHYRGHPLDARNGAPDAAALARAHAALFANPPLAPPCASHEGLDNLINYLEHDFQLRQKRKSGTPFPLAILLDNLEEFRGEGPEAFRGLLRLRQRLRDLNATLWLTQLAPPAGSADARPYLGLADYHAVLDHDGGYENPGAPAGAWEQSFALDPALQGSLQELGLIRVSFAAQGAHRRYSSAYLYHRPTSLFTEITP